MLRTFGSKNLKIPLKRRLVFVGLETLIVAMPVTVILNEIFRIPRAVRDAALGELVTPALLGLHGILLWLAIYCGEEPIYSRVALVTLFGILVLFWASFPLGVLR